jgi:hypothetical protein
VSHRPWAAVLIANAPTEQEVQHSLLADAKVPAQVLVHAQIVAHRFILHRRDMDAGQLTSAKSKGDAAGVAAVRLDAVGGLAGNQARCCHEHRHPHRAQLPIQPEAEAARFIAGVHLRTGQQSGEILLHGSGGISNDVLLHLLRVAGPEAREDDLLFVDIHSDVV